VALRLFRGVVSLSLILGCALALPEAHVRAGSLKTPDLALPALNTFATLVMNGEADQLRGVYAPRLFADRVVQQPDGDPGFVSPRQNVLTQFSRASQMGSTGLLAHNTLAGSQFTLLHKGQVIFLVYGDGRKAAYVVTQKLRYQALQPESAYSDFANLQNGDRVRASELFSSIYGRSGGIVLQTCIEADGLSTWGRLFVIAQRYSGQRLSRQTCSACR